MTQAKTYEPGCDFDIVGCAEVITKYVEMLERRKGI